MTTEQRPDFIEASLKAVTDKETARQAEKRQKFDRQRENMFNSMREILGMDADIVIHDGQAMEIDDMHCIVWGNLGFNPVTGYMCSDRPQFRFAVLDIAGEKPTSVCGWAIINDLLEFGQHLKNGLDRLEEDIRLKQVVKTVEYNPNAGYFERAARRFQNKHPLPIDRLMLAFMKWNEDVFTDQYPDYDDDDDDEGDDD